MSLPKLIAGVVASLLMSLIWFLASPKESQPQASLADLAALRTPITLTLTSGERVSGELQGADSLCADWAGALQADPQTSVQLPDGRTVTGAEVQAVSVGRSPVEGLEAMSKVSACPASLTVRRVGSPAGPVSLNDAAASAGATKAALKSLTGP